MFKMEKTKPFQIVSTNEKSQEYTRAVETAGEVFKLVEKYNSPPHPRNYNIWYSYVLNDEAGLKQKVKDAVKANGTLTEFDANQIFQDCIAGENQDTQANEDVGIMMAEACSTLMNMLDTHIVLNSGFEGTLTVANEKLKTDPTPENLKLVVSTLLFENSKMRHDTSKLNNRLDKSKKQLGALTKDLEAIRETSLTDPLTSVGNRKKFDSILKKNLIQAQQTGTEFCLILADLDNFKQVNDNFGHLVGDAILKVFAKVMTKNIKGQDTVTRYGGEEFAIVLPNTGIQGAIQVAELIRKDIESQDLQVTKNGLAIGKVTSSFGVSLYRQGDNKDTIFSRADEQLYAAKNNGRNCVAA